MFSSEQEMKEAFGAYLQRSLSHCSPVLAFEVPGLFGIPDVVLAEPEHSRTRHILAIELKLISWRRALKQAFRYRSFAWESYVVLDASRSGAAINNIDEFRRYNIGLATYSTRDDFKIYATPRIRRPYSRNLFDKARSLLYANNCQSKAAEHKPNRAEGLAKAFLKTSKCREDAAAPA
jgi:hypothetical protein